MTFFLALPKTLNFAPIRAVGDTFCALVTAQDEGTATENALDILSMLGTTLVGAAAGLVIAVVALVVLKLMGRRRDYFSLAARRAKSPLALSLLIAGGYVGLQHSKEFLDERILSALPTINHVLVILLILALTWLVFQLLYLAEDIPALRFRDSEPRHASRVRTQAQVLRRVMQIVVIISGLVCVIYTFPGARLAMTSLVASAGVISLVAGLAAQSSLANMFAGVQLALTDAIRVGDLVVIGSLDGATSQATVEEITLTYVVLRVWDDRRIVVPSTSFTQHNFENLTRRHTQLLGEVELFVDYLTPVSQIRTQVDKLLSETDLWDGRTATVQVTDSTNTHMVVRVVVSAQNAGNLWDLRCYMREHLIEWLRTKAPQSLPRLRVLPQQVQQVNQDVSAEKVAQLAEELADVAGAKQDLGQLAQQVQAAGVETLEDISEGEDPAHRARLRAAQLHSSQEVVRKSLLDREEGEPTQVMDLNPESVTTQERLFSGSPDAEERGRAFSGPGSKVLEERQRELEPAETDSKKE